METAKTISFIWVSCAFFVMILFWEIVYPLRRLKKNMRSKIHRIAVNLTMSLATLLTAMVSVVPASKWSIKQVEAHSFGVLAAIQAPSWLEAVLGFLLLDLSFYYWHRLNHSWPLLWRFHNVHHIDPELDVSTGFRFHFGEVAASAIFRGAQILFIGPSLSVFLAYELWFRLATFFHHGNIRMPKFIDRWLGHILITPSMHGIHHSNYRDETCSNFGVIFCWWDRLSSTFRSSPAQERITIGIPGYSRAKDNTVGRLLIAPFKKQRDYWRGHLRRM